MQQDTKRNVNVEVNYDDESFWLTQKAMAQLFNLEKSAISKHLTNIFETNEVSKVTSVSKMETVQQEGSRAVKRNVEYYKLDAIIAVGYRVN